MTASATTPTRRCWRCLQDFACDAADVHAGPAEWWLCEPCHHSLIPKKTAAGNS